MSLLDRILGGLPENSLLRAQKAQLEDKNAALETEIAILKDEKRDATAQIKKLEKRIEDLTQIDLSEIDVLILRSMVEAEYGEPWDKAIADYLGLKLELTRYHLQRLVKFGPPPRTFCSLLLSQHFQPYPKGP